jgi:endonuclease-3 related protein
LKVSKEDKIFKIYKILYNYYGSQHWWPADTEFEVIVGAILTQNTTWHNVEKALGNLKRENLLSVKKLAHIPMIKLRRLIKSSGYYNVKAKRIKAMLNFLIKEYDGNIRKIKKQNIRILRSQLLSVDGIGKETADSILLYALDKPVFVIDAYTKRIFSRHSYFKIDTPYSSVQTLFVKNLPRSIKIYNEFHALLVRLAKDYCRTIPICQECPIKGL